jgi:hypothetical protein
MRPFTKAAAAGPAGCTVLPLPGAAVSVQSTATMALAKSLQNLALSVLLLFVGERMISVSALLEVAQLDPVKPSWHGSSGTNTSR